MIDVQPYIDKIEVLKRYMELKIEIGVDNLRANDIFWRSYNDYGMLVSMAMYKIEMPPFDVCHAGKR